MRSGLSEFQRACRRQLSDPAVLVDRQVVADVVTQTLVTYVRQPKPDDNLLAAVDAVLTAAGANPPLLLLLGARRPQMLPVPSTTPEWTHLAETYIKAGLEDILSDLWGAEPEGLLALEEGQVALTTTLEAARSRHRWAGCFHPVGPERRSSSADTWGPRRKRLRAHRRAAPAQGGARASVLSQRNA